MKTRIKELILKEGVTSAQFANEIGIAASSLHHIVSGRNNPSLEVIQKILARFPQINAEWLINGNGNRFKEIIQGELFSVDSVDTSNTREIPEQTPKINPEIPSDIKLGNRTSHHSNKKVERIIVLYTDQSFDIYNS